MARLFISLAHLDTWIEQGRATLGEDQLTTAEGMTYRLLPAVYFATVVSGEAGPAGTGADPNDLLGRVKTKAQLDQIGGEHYQDSVILGEVGYQVVEGFVGEPVG